MEFLKVVRGVIAGVMMSGVYGVIGLVAFGSRILPVTLSMIRNNLKLYMNDKKIKTIGIILTGSKSYSNIDLVKSELEKIILREESRLGEEELLKVDILTDGNSPSLENVASKVLSMVNLQSGEISHSKISALWDKYGKKAGYWRDKRLCELSNYCLVFREGSKDELSSAPYRFLLPMARKERLVIKDFPLSLNSTI